jgi:hypothetical protein
MKQRSQRKPEKIGRAVITLHSSFFTLHSLVRSDLKIKRPNTLSPQRRGAGVEFRQRRKENSSLLSLRSLCETAASLR